MVYFPGDIDRTFWQVLSVDHGKLLRNAVDWATNEARSVTVEGKGILDVAVWEQKNSMTLHLVNLTNPMMMKGPVREIIPISAAKNLVADSRRPARRAAFICLSPRETFRIAAEGDTHLPRNAIDWAA